MSENVFVVLFRGVGGATKLPSRPLREALTAAGFRKVVTYIATGNVVLASDLPAEAVREQVGAIARQALGFAKEIMVMTAAEWFELAAGNPFPEAVGAPRTLHAFALAAIPSAQAVEALRARAAPSEGVVVRGRVLYFHAPEGFGTSKLPPVIDRVLGVASTARNWNTVLKLEALAREAGSH